jgi:tRNA (cytidine32/uridine32-2'-O)-methyltransferase
MSLSNVRIVLVCPSHPGNIGASARAMKNMSLQRLDLVRPDKFPHADALARASGADDLLASAQVHDSLEQALEGCRWVVGTTARERTIGWPTLSPREFARQAHQHASAGEIAVVFGRERTGLTNEEVDRCHALVRIPGNASYSSLNLASAVQILAYEIFLGFADEIDATIDSGATIPSSHEDLERFYAHLEQVLVEIGFLDPDNPRQLMRRLRRLFNRSGLQENELNILRGILTAVQQTEHWRRSI